MLSLPSNVDINDLFAITNQLPDAAPPVKPITSRVAEKRYFAYSRTGRTEGGKRAVHDMSVYRPSMYGTAVAECTCPGFVNHGHCWASDEAKTQYNSPSRKNGTSGVVAR